MQDRIESRTAQNALADRGDDLAGIDDGLHGETDFGAAIDFRNNRILCNVNETTGQVARVGRLQGGVCQTLAGAVGRVEVLVHGQAFLEVRDDRGLDDFTRRLGHQAAHAAKLAHLVDRTTGTRMRHHVDRVHLLLATGHRIEFDGLQARHHLFGDLVGCLAPGVNDLVVLFALRNQAVIVLLFVFGRKRFGFRNDLGLRFRDDHVILAEGDTRTASMGKTKLHDAVTEDNRLFLAAMAVNMVDHLGDVLLGHLLIADIERNVDVLRQQFTHDHAARRRVVNLRHRVAFGIDRLETALDLGVQRDDLVFKRML
ncbi:Uncharacterised protein [Brucella suis]|nr:Uncharacterised protein [Brucella suis]